MASGGRLPWRRGGRRCVGDRRRPHGGDPEGTVRLVEAAGGTARFVIADMTDESQVENAVQGAVEDIGRLHIAINNAGYDGEFQLTQDYSMEMLDHMIALNVRGVFLSMKHELRRMAAHGSGSIVNMSCGAGLVGVRGFSGYTATKAARDRDDEMFGARRRAVRHPHQRRLPVRWKLR